MFSKCTFKLQFKTNLKSKTPVPIGRELPVFLQSKGTSRRSCTFHSPHPFPSISYRILFPKICLENNGPRVQRSRLFIMMIVQDGEDLYKICASL